MSVYVHLYLCVLLFYQITPSFEFTLPFYSFSSKVVPRRPTNSTVKQVNCLPNVSTGPDFTSKSSSKLQGSNSFTTGAEIIKPLSLSGSSTNTPILYENVADVPKRSIVSSLDVSPSLFTSPRSELCPSVLPAFCSSNIQSENGLKAPTPLLDLRSLPSSMISTQPGFHSSNLHEVSLNDLSILPKIPLVCSESTATAQLPLVLNKTPPLSLNQINNMTPILNNDLVKPLPMQDAIYYTNLPQVSVPIPACISAKTNNCDKKLDLSTNSAINEHVYLSNPVPTSSINQMIRSSESLSLDLNINPSVLSTGNKKTSQVLPSSLPEILPAKNTVQGLQITNTNEFATSNNNNIIPIAPNLILNANTQIPKMMSIDIAPQTLQNCLNINNNPDAVDRGSFSKLLPIHAYNLPLPFCETIKCPLAQSKSDSSAATHLNCLNFPMTNPTACSHCILTSFPINNTSSIAPKDLTFPPQDSCITNSISNQVLNTNFLTNQTPYAKKDTSSLIASLKNSPAQPTPSITKVSLPLYDGTLPKTNTVPRIIPESLDLKILPVSTGQPLTGVVRPLLKNNTRCNSTLNPLNKAPSTQCMSSVANPTVPCNSMNQISNLHDNIDSKPLLNHPNQPIPQLKEITFQGTHLPIDVKSFDSFPSHSLTTKQPPSLPQNTRPITENTFEPKTFSCDNAFNINSLFTNIPKLTLPADVSATSPISNVCLKNTFDNPLGLCTPITEPSIISNVLPTTVSRDENINLDKTLLLQPIINSGLPNLATISSNSAVTPVADISLKQKVNFNPSPMRSSIETSFQSQVLNLPVTSNAIPSLAVKNSQTSASPMFLPSNISYVLPPQNECVRSSPYGNISPRVPPHITDNNKPNMSPEIGFRLPENSVNINKKPLVDTIIPLSQHFPTDIVRPKPFSVTELPSINSVSKNFDSKNVNKGYLNDCGYNVFNTLPQINLPPSPSYLPNCIPSIDINIANKNVGVGNQPSKSLNSPIGTLADIDVTKIATLLQKPFLKVPSLCNIQPVTSPNKSNLLTPSLPSISNSIYIDSHVPNIALGATDPTKVYSCVQTGHGQNIPKSSNSTKYLPVPMCATYPGITLPSALPRSDYQQLTKPIAEAAISNVSSLPLMNDCSSPTTCTMTNVISSVSSEKTSTGKGIVSTNQDISSTSVPLIPIGDILQLVEIYPRNTSNFELSKDNRFSSPDKMFKLNTPLELCDVSKTPNSVSFLSLENIVSPVNNFKLSSPKTISQNSFNLQSPLPITEILDPVTMLHPNSGVFLDILLPVVPECFNILPNPSSLDSFCILQDNSYLPPTYMPVLSDLTTVSLTEILPSIKIAPPSNSNQTNLSTLDALTTKLTNACVASAIANLTSSNVKRMVPEVHVMPKVTIPKIKAKTKSKKYKSTQKNSKRRKNKNSSMFGCASSDIPVYVEADEVKHCETNNLPDILLLSTNNSSQCTDNTEFTEKEVRVDNSSDLADNTDDFLENRGVDIESVLSSDLSSVNEMSLNTLILATNVKEIPKSDSLEKLAEYIVLKELVNSNLNSNWDLLGKIIDVLCFD